MKLNSILEVRLRLAPAPMSKRGLCASSIRVAAWAMAFSSGMGRRTRSLGKSGRVGLFAGDVFGQF